MEEDNIRSIFAKYLQDEENYESFEMRELRHKLIDDFETFLNKNYRQIDSEGRYINYCVESTAHHIPYMFNGFFEVMLKKGWEASILISELSKLGWWIYKNKYTE